jgi:hypothetical protein
MQEKTRKMSSMRPFLDIKSSPPPEGTEMDRDER